MVTVISQTKEALEKPIQLYAHKVLYWTSFAPDSGEQHADIRMYRSIREHDQETIA